MRRFWRRSEDALERALAAHRPEAPSDLVARLAGRVEQMHHHARAPRRGVSWPSL